MAEILKATHDGEITIANKIIPCAILENGDRIITQGAVFAVFERPPRGLRKYDRTIKLPESMKILPSFIAARNLMPYISEDTGNLIQL